MILLIPIWIGRCALHWAVIAGQADVVKQLIREGAPVGILDQQVPTRERMEMVGGVVEGGEGGVKVLTSASGYLTCFW